MPRTLRFTLAIAAAVVLAGALLYTSFSGSAEAREPSQMATAVPGKDYQLTGVVVAGSYKRDGEAIRFRVRDRKGNASVPVVYTGQIPDAFREGREVIVTVDKTGSTYTGKTDSLVTKCPSKFSSSQQAPTGAADAT